MTVIEIHARLLKLGDKQKAQSLQKFFKTGPGEYGEGDILLDIRVPDLRTLVKEYRGLTAQEVLRYHLAKSESLRERRISVLATFPFIKYRQMSDTLKIAGLLLADKEDLIHKAVGKTDWLDSALENTPVIIGDFILTEVLLPA